ncbi:MAG: tetratricopeptide repeat protein, partial [Myxococcota bacterium]
PRGGGTSAPSIQQADQSAADHEAVGDDAANGGDWSTAVMAYKKAVSLDGKSARLMSKLGRAQLESGDRGTAQVTLQRAAQMGAKDAHKHLGRVLEAEGDIAGAIASYQQYLKSGPSDAAAIEETIRKLSGG